MATSLSELEFRNGSEPDTQVIEWRQPQDIPVRVPAGKLETGTNLIETWTSYCVQMALPGVDLASLRIEVVARRLTVSGKYRVPVIEGGSAIWRGILAEDFSRAFELPAEVDEDKAQAEFDRGILTIRLPKVAYLRTSSIKVQRIQ
jgi:HSP20 family molecular chaperone IbpA